MDTFTWSLKPFSWAVAERIAQELELPMTVAVVLARRGFADVEQVRGFLEISDLVPDPFLFSDMQAAVDAVNSAAAAGRRIVVHGDYDVDGVSATALLIRGLADLGVRAEHYLPSRFVHGYGLSELGVREIAAGGDALLITVDCGINYPDEVALARRLGLDVVVTDHHQPGDTLPECPLIHAVRGDYPHADLCGVGIAFKLLHGLHVDRNEVSPHRIPENLLPHLDLVALGTIADLVPLRGENRYYVSQGVVRIATSGKAGLRALVSVVNGEGRVDAQTVGFRLAPRLNAAGRLTDPEIPLRLLLTDDVTEAEALAQELDALNRERQAVEAVVLGEALAVVEARERLPRILVVAGSGWHEGVLGIVASRLVERYHRPAVLLSIADGRARGSARSIPLYDIMAGLTACAAHLTVFGGHHQAAGLTLPETAVEAFTADLERHAADSLRDEDLVPTYHPDAVAVGTDLNLETVDAIARLAPFGLGNPKVKLIALDARIEDPRATRKGDHLQCTLVVDDVRTRGIGFGLAQTLADLREGGLRAHAGIRLEASEWQGTSRAEVQLHSLYRTGDLGEGALGCSPTCPFLDDLEAPPACPSCSDPLAGAAWSEVTARDLRDVPGRLARTAEILSSGEPAVILGADVKRHMTRVGGALPLREVGVNGVDCVSRHCWRTRLTALRDEALLFADWDAAERRSELLCAKRHVIMVDPTYRASHTALLRRVADSGARVHLLYGEEERRLTETELRVRMHPRHWMVALYRALQSGETRDGLFGRVLDDSWVNEGIMPTADDLRRSMDLLDALGHGSNGGEQATMKASQLPAYAAAEAAFEEAVRSCRKK
ncbi:MAG: single-stranded-DNA-specific exonuclease RecJ [Thermoleophilia bacterium]